MNSYNLIHTSHSYVPVTIINRGVPSCLLFFKSYNFVQLFVNTYALVKFWPTLMNS